MNKLLALFAFVVASLLLLGCAQQQEPQQPAQQAPQTGQAPAAKAPAPVVQFPPDITEDAGLNSSMQEIDDANAP